MTVKSLTKSVEAANSVDLYLLRPHHLDDLPESCQTGNLTDAQELRAASMSGNRAREYRLSRWLLRKALNQALLPAGVTRIDIIEQPDLPPCSPQAEAAGLDFSISHSSGYIAVAVSSGGNVGLDVEWTARPRRFLEIARQYFSPTEVSLLEKADSDDARTSLFYLLWTQKEAYLKSRKLGIGAIPLSDICFKPFENKDGLNPKKHSIASCIAFGNLQLTVVSRRLTDLHLIETGYDKEEASGNFEDASIKRYLYDDSAKT